MPCEDFEALDARRRARCSHGVDSDDSTVKNDDDDEDGGLAVQVGQDNPDLEQEMNEEAIVDTIEVTIRRSTTSMFMHVLMFSRGAANSLYDDQMITSFDTLQELQFKIRPSHVEYVPRKLCMSQNTHGLNIFTYCGGH